MTLARALGAAVNLITWANWNHSLCSILQGYSTWPQTILKDLCFWKENKNTLMFLAQSILGRFLPLSWHAVWFMYTAVILFQLTFRGHGKTGVFGVNVCHWEDTPPFEGFHKAVVNFLTLITGLSSGSCQRCHQSKVNNPKHRYQEQNQSVAISFD